MTSRRNIPNPDLQEDLFDYLRLLASEGECPDDVTEAAKQIHASHARMHEYGRGEDFLRSVAQQHAKDGDYVYAFEALLQWAFLREFRSQQINELVTPLNKLVRYVDDYQSPYTD